MRLLTLFSLFIGAVNVASQPMPIGRDAIFLNEFVGDRLSAAALNGPVSKLTDVCAIDSDPVAARVFREYGAIYTVADNAKFPPKCIFENADAVESFHASLEIAAIKVGMTEIELQKAAAEALKAAIEDAERVRKKITALDGSIAGRRSYQDTLRIWNSRFFPALDHWVAQGKISREEANYTITLPLNAQIMRVMAWESRGYFFSTNRTISIFNSVAPPGTSQHLSMLAFDVVESSDPVVQRIMNQHGWFQTIRSDQPHFTYIGVSENELPRRGLIPFRRGSRTYWVPNVKER